MRTNHTVIFLVLFLVWLGEAQNCNTVTENLYYGTCVKKACLGKMINTLKSLTSLGAYVAGRPSQMVIITGFTTGVGPFISIQWQDGQSNEWMMAASPADRQSCVDFAFYQISDGTTAAKRISVVAENSPDGFSSAWPYAFYVQNPTAYLATVTAQFTVDDVKAKCPQQTQFTEPTYLCYFELAFRVSGMTQFSAYVSVQYSFKGAAATVSLDVSRMTQYSPTNVQQITIGSSLGIYTVLNNNNNVMTVGSPATSVIVGQPFYIEHLITDSAFKSWFITNPSISYTGGAIGGSADFNLIVQGPGRNIYQLTATVVSPNTQLLVQGSLTPAKRILQTSNQTYAAYKQIPFPIVKEQLDSLAIFADQALKTALTKVDYGNQIYLKLSLSDKTTVELNPIVCYKNDTHVQEVPFKQVKITGGSSIFSIIANNLDESMTRLCVVGVASDDQLENILCTDAPKINNVYTTVSTSLSNNNFLAGSVAPSSISVGKPVYIMLKLTKLASYQMKNFVITYGNKIPVQFTAVNSQGKSILTIKATSALSLKQLTITATATNPQAQLISTSVKFPLVK